MIYFKLNGLGDEIAYDDETLTYPEGLELERQTGLGANRFMAELGEGTTRSTAAVLWIGAVRADVVAKGISFRDAAKGRPFEAFIETIDLMASMKSSRRQKADVPVDPTPAPPSGPGEPTSPDMSAPAPAPQGSPSPASAVTTSVPSPSSSASAPGSGTS